MKPSSAAHGGGVTSSRHRAISAPLVVSLAVVTAPIGCGGAVPSFGATAVTRAAASQRTKAPAIRLGSFQCPGGSITI